MPRHRFSRRTHTPRLEVACRALVRVDSRAVRQKALEEWMEELEDAFEDALDQRRDWIRQHQDRMLREDIRVRRSRLRELEREWRHMGGRP